ncbi:permease family-domain-containing protein [Rhodocollybia butyracea]|uniref:Permease family-domain-containing protein n=1 Tax=Rhodocollybia butyracea TaxID=206335 RepID=A0A9P5TXC2_9AGAR|nr:permease family-domain-containing protein [Rhodocollybia butyracea]
MQTVHHLVSCAMEATGDITASAEVSRVDVEGLNLTLVYREAFYDGLGGFISALFTVAPLSVFAQNNGVIAITCCANRVAGRWCCAFLILFGVLGKISGVFLAIPNPIIGAVTTFLFASVAVSGVRVLALMKFTRRDRFILAAGVNNPNSGLAGLFNSITIVLSTPFLAVGLVALILNAILPVEVNEVVMRDDQSDAEDQQDRNSVEK